MSETKLPSYGGQAVIEGVMMRGKANVAIAMRDPEGNIQIHTEKLGGIYKTKISKTPFLRGLVLLWDALGLGMRALTISANAQTGEDEQLEGLPLALTLIASLAFAVALFFLAPATVGHFTEQWLNITPWLGNLLEGIVRLLILIGYMWIIGKMEDVRRVFMYHGAEHKVINAFEDGAEMTPEIVKDYPLEHPRCGTAFMLVVILLSIILFTLAGPMDLLPRLLYRLLLIPVLASVAYEYLRFTANHTDNPVIRWLIKPNLALQKLTTKEPDLEMLEVSIAAFTKMKELEEALDIVL